jgi:hypothetical protein
MGPDATLNSRLKRLPTTVGVVVRRQGDMMRIVDLAADRGVSCERILRTLPEWFGTERGITT